MALSALKLFFPTNFKIVPPGLSVVADLLLLYSLTLDHLPPKEGKGISQTFVEKLRKMHKS